MSEDTIEKAVRDVTITVLKRLIVIAKEDVGWQSNKLAEETIKLESLQLRLNHEEAKDV